MTVTGFGEAGAATLASGACCAWPLPPDATCAGMARRIYREAAAGLGMREDLIDDGVTMVSELAANTLHASQQTGQADLPVTGTPELWLSVRRAPGGWELACKAFDAQRGWKQGTPPKAEAADPDAVTGRGLQVVANLSDGRWGHHLTRSRLGGWTVPGKAVWFGLPVPSPQAQDWRWRSRLVPAEAAGELAGILTERGLGERLMVTDEPAGAMAVLSVGCGLTVWCRNRVIFWRTRTGRYERQAVTDLVDCAEEVVSVCEEIDHGLGSGYPGVGRLR